jgi:hypothetical protein
MEDQQGRKGREQRRGAPHHRKNQREVPPLQSPDHADLIEEMRRQGEGEGAPGRFIGRRDEEDRRQHQHRRARRKECARDQDVAPHLHRHVGRRERHRGKKAEADREKGGIHRPKL